MDLLQHSQSLLFTGVQGHVHSSRHRKNSIWRRGGEDSIQLSESVYLSGVQNTLWQSGGMVATRCFVLQCNAEVLQMLG